MHIRAHDQLHARVNGLAPIAEIAPLIDAFAGEVYLVGGTVRDLILDRQFIDVDLAVEGDSAELAAEIGKAETPETKFGTSSARRAGIRYDLARTRSETYAHPGALPDVAPAGIDADLRRRDFTVNAIALGLSGRRAGELIAADGALDDIEARRLAVLHDASFLDDPTRLLRLARYAARLDFTIAPHTRELAQEAVANGALDTVSGTRLGNELRLLANEPDPIAAFEAVVDLGLPWKIDRQLATSALLALPDDGRADRVVLACVFGSQPPEQVIAELDRLDFTATERDAIAEAATRAPELAKRLAHSNSNSEIARSVGAFGIETVALASSQGSPSQSQTWLQHLRHLTLDINGQDLINNGIPEGPAVGRALARARDALLDGVAPDRDSQLAVALRPDE